MTVQVACAIRNEFHVEPARDVADEGGREVGTTTAWGAGGFINIKQSIFFIRSGIKIERENKITFFCGRGV